MNENHTKAHLKNIVENMIDELKECEDGTVFATSELLASLGYDVKEYDFSDLLYLDHELRKAAQLNHIKLDRSSHHDKVEGLLFNLDFVVHNKSAQIKCPYCGSKSTARILYGMPAFNDDLEKKISDGKISIGGCKLMGVEIDGAYVQTNPKRFCNTCKKQFASPPLLIAKDWSSAEYYHDIVTSIRFSVGGYFQGRTEVIIKKNNKGALVKVTRFPDEDAPEDRQITKTRWDRILYNLYCQLYIHEWKRTYDDPSVKDGTQWELEIKLTNRRKRVYSGSNAFPPYWKELVALFRPFTKSISKTQNP